MSHQHPLQLSVQPDPWATSATALNSLYNGTANEIDLLSACNPSTFAEPTLFGADFTSVIASPVTNYSAAGSIYNFNDPQTNLTDCSFCNVTWTYTHPGQNDLITVQAWLPISNPPWNGRFQAVGGGGWVAGLFYLSYQEMNGALADGFATITTDAGLTTGNDPDSVPPGPWAQTSPGNVNLYALQNLGSVSLVDEAIIGKEAIKKYYGSGPEYSYWSGCSQGGRQGLMLAQRYPDVYDGIVANAPAIYWSELFASIYWADFIISYFLNGTAPASCEVLEISALALAECDGLDGVVDGLISYPDECPFDALSAVGTEFNCSTTGEITTISEAAATWVKYVWDGPKAEDGDFIWYGYDIGSFVDPVAAISSAKRLGAPWVTNFVVKNVDYDLSSITRKEFEWIVHQSIVQYDSIIGTSDPNLDAFSQRGGKIVGYHGLADSTIPAGGSRQYHHAVANSTKVDIQDFYRFFPVPGLGHCYGGTGGQPTGTFAALVDWVENGVSPDTIPISFTTTNGTAYNRILCPFPSKVVYDGVGDATVPSSYSCQ